MKKNFVSIIIVNFNGKKWLRNCFDSLYQQTYKDFEIILVDNNSTDGSQKLIKKYYPKIELIQSKKNLGFAGGNNLGVQFAQGDLVLLLNNDTWATKDYLENFVKAFLKIPHLGIAQSKILLMERNKQLDNCGSFWTKSTLLYHYGCLKKGGQELYNQLYPIFSAKGASMLIKKEIIDKIGLFDSRFWCYYEETDFCHRAWVCGYECWYYPKAVIHHALGATSKKFDNSIIQFHNYKNKLASYLKNFSIGSLLTIIPIYLFLNIILIIIWAVQGKIKNSFVIIRAWQWNFTHLKGTLEERKKIQSLRKKTDREIFKKTERNPRLSYYYYLFTGLEKYEDK